MNNAEVNALFTSEEEGKAFRLCEHTKNTYFKSQSFDLCF